MAFLLRKLSTPFSRIRSAGTHSSRSRLSANIDSRNRIGEVDGVDPPPYAAVAADSQTSYLHPVVASPDIVSPLSCPPPAEDIRYGTDNQYSFLSEFDTIFLVDDSASMIGQSWREAEEAITAITPVCTKYDSDGIDIFFLNHHSTSDGSGGYLNIKSPATVQEIFRGVLPKDATPVGKRLQQILLPYLSQVQEMAAHIKQYGSLRDLKLAVRPINIIVITDGVFSDDAESVILRAVQTLEECDADPWQIGIQFFQIGTDITAQKYLKQLDDDLGKAVKNGQFRDIVDTVPWKGQTGRTLSGDGILKVVLGAVNKRLDREKGHSYISSFNMN